MPRRITLLALTLLAGCGGGSASAPRSSAPTQGDVSSQARSELLRAGRDVLAFGRTHATFDVGGVAGLHHLDARTGLVNFVDGRQTSFFLAVRPPTTSAIWRFDYDHRQVSRAECRVGPGRRCWGLRRW